ncbi:hypothetical protein HYR69_02240, partial [Candidatus Sumerlaeota bacterium]|nr:hypothetical protein [Candidatus Sumerlaeota bacterium]
GGGFYEYYLGTSLNDGDWHYVELDLQSRLDQFSGPAIANVTTVAFFAQDLFVDDMILSKGMLGKSYGVVPGLLNYLGAQSGSSGGTGQSAWSKWYYQQNDLGTVVATTDAVGGKICVSEPDFYGNYQYTSGTRPDSLGLTSKFLDTDSGLCYFGYRWYDLERGRWVSREPGRYDGQNLYQFTHDMPFAAYDPNGLETVWYPPMLPPREDDPGIVGPYLPGAIPIPTNPIVGGILQIPHQILKCQQSLQIDPFVDNEN